MESKPPINPRLCLAIDIDEERTYIPKVHRLAIEDEQITEDQATKFVCTTLSYGTRQKIENESVTQKGFGKNSEALIKGGTITFKVINGGLVRVENLFTEKGVLITWPNEGNKHSLYKDGKVPIPAAKLETVRKRVLSHFPSRLITEVSNFILEGSSLIEEVERD